MTDVQVVTPEDESPGDSAVAPLLPPNPVLGGVDIFYNCPDGCDDLSRAALHHREMTSTQPTPR